MMGPAIDGVESRVWTGFFLLNIDAASCLPKGRSTQDMMEKYSGTRKVLCIRVT